jgi:glycosyltransferase involved in cell wall biosynthesis
MSALLAAEQVRHIPAVLYHRHRVGGGDAAAARELDASDAQALAGHLAQRGIHAEIIATRPGCRRLRYALPDVPQRVSIIIPSRDQVALLRQCVESLLTKTRYANYEILVLDNQSVEPETLAYLAALADMPQVRVLHYDLPFNFAAINNYAAEEADGDILCLLNNDTEVISPDWLEEMLGHLVQQGVGVVGAKLLYPDGRIQHGGDAVGPGGCADHLHSMIDGDAPGYCNRALIAQELSAVTAACLLTWKGLKVWRAGYRVIWTPHARLFHHESATRGQDNSPEKLKCSRMEADYIRKHWPDRIQHDPFYNPNLSYTRPDFSLSQTPRLRKPWLE